MHTKILIILCGHASVTYGVL